MIERLHEVAHVVHFVAKVQIVHVVVEIRLVGDCDTVLKV